MNSKNRRNLAEAERLFVFVVNSSIKQLQKVIEDMYEQENDKLNNLPEALQEVTAGQCISDSIEMLEDKMTALESISEEIESSFPL